MMTFFFVKTVTLPLFAVCPTNRRVDSRSFWATHNFDGKLIFISPFEQTIITSFVQEWTLILFGVVVSFLSLNVFETIYVVDPGSTQISSLSSPASSTKRLLNFQFTCLVECFGLKFINSLWGVVHDSTPTLGDNILLLQISRS